MVKIFTFGLHKKKPSLVKAASTASDWRIKLLDYGSLKKFLLANGVPEKKLFGCADKFALLSRAESLHVSLEPLLEALEASSEGKAAAAAVIERAEAKRSAAEEAAAPAPAAPTPAYTPPKRIVAEKAAPPAPPPTQLWTTPTQSVVHKVPSGARRKSTIEIEVQDALRQRREEDDRVAAEKSLQKDKGAIEAAEKAMAERAAAQQKVEEEVMAQRAAAERAVAAREEAKREAERKLADADEAASAAATAVAEAGGKGVSAKEMKRLRKEMELKKKAVQKHRRQSKVEAALAAKAKEAHVKVVKETGERLSEAKQNSVLEFAALKELDVPVREALANGSIRLLDAEWLRSTSSANAPKRMQRRQDLEEGERTASEYHHDDGQVPLSPFLSAQEAVRLLGAGDRSVGVLSYGWTTRGDPDPLGSYLQGMRLFLRGPKGQHIKGVFWDFACLHQRPRTEAEDDHFSSALGVMAALYASVVGTTVIRHKGIPPRPKEMDGVIMVDSVQDTPETEAELKAALAKHGALKSMEKQDSDGDGCCCFKVSFETHKAAQSAVAFLRDTPPSSLSGCEVWEAYNSRPYADRGWCHLESAVGTEVVARAEYYADLAAQLHRLPPKFLDISSNGLAKALTIPPDHRTAGVRSNEVIKGFGEVSFTGKGDAEVVVALYRRFANTINDAMSASGARVNLLSYIGELNAANEREGIGTLWTEIGDIYSGRFQHGQYEGEGTYCYADGGVYCGTFHVGLRHGKGIYFAPGVKGSIHEGEFRNNQMEGVGTHWHGNVDYVEVGNYSGGKPTGKGVLWNIHDKSVAWTMQDGKQGEQITKEVAEGIARSLGVAVPDQGKPVIPQKAVLLMHSGCMPMGFELVVGDECA